MNICKEYDQASIRTNVADGRFLDFNIKLSNNWSNHYLDVGVVPKANPYTT